MFIYFTICLERLTPLNRRKGAHTMERQATHTGECLVRLPKTAAHPAAAREPRARAHGAGLERFRMKRLTAHTVERLAAHTLERLAANTVGIGEGGETILAGSGAAKTTQNNPLGEPHHVQI